MRSFWWKLENDGCFLFESAHLGHLGKTAAAGAFPAIFQFVAAHATPSPALISTGFESSNHDGHNPTFDAQGSRSAPSPRKERAGGVEEKAGLYCEAHPFDTGSLADST